MRVSHESSGVQCAKQVADDARNARNIPFHVPARNGISDETLFQSAVAALAHQSICEKLIGLNDLLCLMKFRSPICTNLTHDHVISIIELLHAPEIYPIQDRKTALCVQNYAFRLLIEVVQMRHETLDLIGREENISFAISRLPLSSAAEFLSFLACATPDLHKYFLTIGLPSILLNLLHAVLYQDPQVAIVLRVLSCFKNELELNANHIEDIQLVVKRGLTGYHDVFETALEFMKGLRTGVFDEFLIDVFSGVKADFLTSQFARARLLLLDVIYEVVGRSAENAEALMHNRCDIGKFVLSVLKTRGMDEAVQSRSLQIIAAIVSYGPSFCVAFSGSNLVLYLCNVFKDGSFNERVLSLEYFLRVMSLPMNEIIANLLEMSNVLSFCVSVLNSSEYDVIVKVLTVFSHLWRRTATSRMAHPFYRHFLELFEDDTFIETLLDIRDSENREASEVAEQLVALLNSHGVAIPA